MAKSIALALLNQGPHRRHNEDNVYILDRYAPAGHSQTFEHSAASSDALQFFAVADGMGGGGIGDLASRTVMRVLDQQRRAQGTGGRFDFTSFARDTVDLANRAVCEQLAAYEGLRVGTTFSLLAINQDTAYTISLGDSRIYLYREGQLQRLTEDHLSQMPDHHQLTRYLGFLADAAILESDNMTRTVLGRGDILLLMTDGVSDALTDEQILTALGEPAAFIEQIRHLRDLALRQGSRDNLSLIGVKIQDPDAAAPPKTKKMVKRGSAARRADRQAAVSAGDARKAGSGSGIWPGGIMPSWMRFLMFFLVFVLLGIALGKIVFSLPAWLGWLNNLLSP